MYLGVDVEGAVKDGIFNGIDIITEQGTDPDKFRVMLITIIAQILATIVLLLIVRFKFWNVVTNIIESRKKIARQELNDAKAAKEEALATREEIATQKALAKEESKDIIEKAKAQADAEANRIVSEATKEAEAKLAKANAEIVQQEKDLRKNLQKEIVDVAYCLADKMIAGQMDEQKTSKVINEYLESEKEHE